MGRRRENKQHKRRQALVAWFLAALMVFSLAGVFLGSTQGNTNPGEVSLEYGDYTFVDNGYYYTTKIDGVVRSFGYYPLDVLNVEIPAEAMSALSRTALIAVTFNPKSHYIDSIELSNFQLERNSGRSILKAVTNSSDVYPYTVMQCSEASELLPIIHLIGNNKTESTTYNNGCITIEGDGLYITKSVEKIIYQLLGVIDG